MNKIYFVTTKLLKESTTINDNVDDYLLNNSIWEAQEINVQNACGTVLYRKINDLISTGDISLPANAQYKSLLDVYIQPVVIYWAWAYIIPMVHYKIMNKGVQNQNSDNSTSTAINEMQYLKDEVRNKADFFTERLCDYLLANKHLFPEYTRNHKIDELHPDGNAYFSGVQFDGHCDRCIRQMGYPWRTIDLI